MADDKKRRKKAAEPPKNDNNQEPPKTEQPADNNQEPPKAEQPADDNTGKSPRELWNDMPAADKEKIKAGEFIFDADEEPTDEELTKHIFEELEAEAQSLTEKVNKLQDLDVTTDDNLSEYRKSLNRLTNTLKDLTAEYLEAAKINVQIPAFDAIQKLIDAILSNDALQQYIADYEQLKPFVNAELRKPKYRHRTLAEITRQEWEDIETAAREAMAAAQESALPSFTAKKTTGLHFPLSKMHDDLFNKLAIETADKKSIPGQISFSNIHLAVERKGDKPRTVQYSIAFNDFNDAKITKALTQYDRRVYDAIGSLFTAINPTNDRNIDVVISLSQIYYAMGNAKDKDPNPTQLKKILDCMTKIKNGEITLDQSEDYAEYVDKSKGKLGFEYKGQLLYFEIIKANVNGKLVEAAIRIFTEPILFKLAKDRGQITTIPRAVLITGKSKNETNIALENYLFDRIAKMKNSKGKKSGHSSNRIKYASMYEALGIKNTGTSSERMKKKRATDNMYELLEHFKATKWIKGYKQSDNAKGEPCVEIYF